MSGSTPNFTHRHLKSIPNDKITSDDARHFTKTVPVAGPHAVSWTDALDSIAPLLKCDASWARFDGALGDMSDKDINAMSPPCGHASIKSLNSGFDEANGGMPRAVDPATFDSFPSLPAEIRNGVWLALERPVIVKAYAYRFYTHDPVIKLIIWTPGTQPFERDPDKDSFRDWADMPIFDVCQESEEFAVREFGRRSRDSLPFRSSVDELRVVVDGDAVMHYDPLYDRDIRSRGFKLLVPCGCGRQACRRCKNIDLMKDPNLAILFATGNSYRVEEDVTELVAPSADFLNRIHRVTIDLSERDTHLRRENWPFVLRTRWAAASRYGELAASLRRNLPNLSTLTILVEPMRCENAEKPNPGPDDDFFDPKTTDSYHAERIYLLHALTSLVEVNHARGCDRSPERCNCLPLPFPKLKTLVVRVDTREKLAFLCNFGASVFQESRFIFNARRNVLVFKKGSTPLLSNCLGLLPLS